MLSREQLQKLQERVNWSLVATAFVENVPTVCERFNSQEFQTERARLFIHNFTRYSKRAFFFAKKLIESIAVYFDDDYARKHVEAFRGLGYPVKENLNAVPVDDDIFFYFDALIFSSKSLFDKNIYKGFRSLHHKSHEIAEPLLDMYKRDFDIKILNTIRNEVVHLDFVGSSFTSHAVVECDESPVRIKIESMFKKKDTGEVLDLLDLFRIILQCTSDFFLASASVIIHHYFMLLGPPIKNLGLHSGGIIVRLSDFDIIDFDVPK